MASKPHSNTEKKQSTHKRNTSGLIPFKPGPDPRRNVLGRPKSFDKLRALFQDIAGEEITLNGRKYTRAEAIGLAMSADKKLMREFLEFAYGKVPQAVEVGGKDGEPIKVVVEYANTDSNPAETP